MGVRTIRCIKIEFDLPNSSGKSLQEHTALMRYKIASTKFLKFDLAIEFYYFAIFLYSKCQ